MIISEILRRNAGSRWRKRTNKNAAQHDHRLYGVGVASKFGAGVA